MGSRVGGAGQQSVGWVGAQAPPFDAAPSPAVTCPAHREYRACGPVEEPTCKSRSVMVEALGGLAARPPCSGWPRLGLVVPPVPTPIS